MFTVPTSGQFLISIRTIDTLYPQPAAAPLSCKTNSFQTPSALHWKGGEIRNAAEG